MAFIYDEDVALRYDAAVPVQAGEIEFYLELAREAGERGLSTLELACGSGRIAVPLAREGVRLVGLANLQGMLWRAAGPDPGGSASQAGGKSGEISPNRGKSQRPSAPFTRKKEQRLTRRSKVGLIISTRFLSPESPAKNATSRSHLVKRNW